MPGKVVAWLRCGGQLLYISRCRKMCEVASVKNFENSLTTVKVMTKTKVVPFYLGHGVLTAEGHHMKKFQECCSKKVRKYAS